MCYLARFFFIALLTFYSSANSERDDQAEVKYYVELIKNRTEAARNFELPTDARIHEPTNTTVEEYGVFDFIVIGAGSTGSIIASRLSEVKEWSVLLIEAGTFPDQDLTRIPALYALDGQSKFNWGYKTIPQENAGLKYGQFDFIIVGAGSTGCIIANRLSEVGKWSVLLLEAGTYPDQDLTRIPALHNLDENSKFNWGYHTVPQKYFCLNNPDRRCLISMGKGIGGSSLINGLMYVRGNKDDYNKWSDLLNDNSYKYENLLPYFLKTENFTKTDPNAPIDWDRHGTNGLLHMSQSISNSELQTAIIRSFKEQGYNLTDYNGRQQLGVSIIQTYIDNGIRDDPGLAFIFTARTRTNLEVLDNSYVIKVDINKETKATNGVIFTRGNKTYIARNHKEVILSAGSLGSPKILMLSGVGPEDHLNSLEIPVIENLPVGTTLQDHVTASLTFSSNVSVPLQTIEELIREFLKGRGPLTSALAFNTLAWLKLPTGIPGNSPDVEFIFTKTGTYQDPPNTLTLLITLLYPKSKGSFQLRSNDSFDYPLIDSNLLSDERDMELFYESIGVISKLMEAEPLRRLNVTLVLTEFDECNRHDQLSKEFWYCYFRRITIPGHHCISTCLTGTNPQTAVVDKNLKVFGIKNLRVADASVVPFPLANHPTATCAMTAEKISDQIKNDYYI